MEVSRRDVLRGLVGGAGLVALGGAAAPSAWAQQAGVRRARALVAPGLRPDPTKPEGVDTLPEIEHVVIYMQENHSFDSYFGMLGRGDGYTLAGGGRPLNANPDVQGHPVPVFHAPSTCDTSTGASQSWNASHLSWNGGAMDGFVRAGRGGTGSMGYYDEADLPFYYSLARTFPLCDRWFCSVLGQTFPNRRYLQAATSMGIVSTDLNEVLATPAAPNGVIWDRLNAHGISWADYTIDLPDILLFPDFAKSNSDHIKKFSEFVQDCARATLPRVSIISPGSKAYSEESPGDSRNGEAYSAAIIHAVMQSPAWGKTVLFFTYDEHGGYYDHVAPPPAAVPDNIAPRLRVPPDQPGGFDRLGVRVPAVIVSPFAKRNYVSHVVHDHTSILKFIETKFNLGAMTFRDANADNLLDALDFARPGFVDPPPLSAPALTVEPSACQPLALPEQPIKVAPPAGVSTSPPPDRPRPTGASASDNSPALPVATGVGLAALGGATAAALVIRGRHRREGAPRQESDGG